MMWLGALLLTGLLAQQDATFDELIREAQKYDAALPSQGVEKDADRAIALYEQALAIDDTSPETMRHKYRMAMLLEDKLEEPERLRAGRRAFREIVETYDPMDYYASRPHDGNYDDFQAMLTSIFYAEARPDESGETLEDRRALYLKGIHWLDQAWHRRRSDLLAEEKPKPTPLEFAGRGGEGKNRQRLENWEARQERARAGDIFGERHYEMGSLRALLLHYGSTYGAVSPDEVREIMRPIIQKFPDSQCGREAARIVQKARIEYASAESVDWNELTRR